MSNNDFENFFNDPDDDLFRSDDLDNLDDFGQPSFPEDDFEDLPDVEEEPGISRTFIIAGAVLGAAFLGLMGVIGFLLLQGDDSISESALQATNISATNFAIETQVAASETAISEQETAVVLTEQARFATETAEAVQRATATQQSLETSVAATETQLSIDSTATQFVVNQTLTAEAASPTPGRIVIQVMDPTGNAPVANAVVCVFIDNGDGVFNPPADTPPLCVSQSGGGAVPAATTPTLSVVTVTPGATAGTPLTTPTRQATIQSTQAATTSTGGAIATPTSATGGNPFQRATLQAQTATAAAGGGNSISPQVTPSPTGSGTPEAEGSGYGEGFSAASYLLPVGRSISDPQGSGAVQQDDGEEDIFQGQFFINEQGQLVIEGLPPGQYWIKIADQTLPIQVTTEAQLLTIDTATGPLEILIPGAVSGVGGPTTEATSFLPSPTPERTLVSPIDQTNTAIFRQTQGFTQEPTVQPSPTELDRTGLFSGDSSEVTGSDLLILAVAGMVLVGVVMAARRMRSAA